MNKQIKFGIILQYAQMFLNIVISLVYTPIMLKVLGQSEYGIYNLAASIISYLSLLSLGFGSSYIRYYSRYKASDDNEGIKKLNGLYLIVFSFIGIISLILGFLISNNVSIFFNSTYSEQDLHIAKILMIFLTINLAISFPSSLFISYITSQERFIFQKLVNMGKTILSPILCIVFLFMGYGSIGMVVVTTVISLIIDIINVSYCLIKLKMRLTFKNIQFSLLKEIFVFSIFIAINAVIDQINWQTDKIILGKMISGSAVAIYAVAATINSMYINFSTSISSVFTPKINRVVSERKDNMDEELTDIFIRVGKIQLLIVGLILTGFIFFGKYFIFKWAGSSYEDAYYVALFLMCPAIVPLIQNIGIEIQRAKNLHKFRSIVYLFMAILNVIVSIFLCDRFGVVGVAAGTAMSMIAANIIIMNIYYHKKTGINIILFWKKIMKTLSAFVIPVIVGICINCFVEYTNIIIYFVMIVIYCVVYLVNVYLFGLSSDDKKAIMKRKENV